MYMLCFYHLLSNSMQTYFSLNLKCLFQPGLSIILLKESPVSTKAGIETLKYQANYSESVARYRKHCKYEIDSL